jgi:phage tail-like protein
MKKVLIVVCFLFSLIMCSNVLLAQKFYFSVNIGSDEFSFQEVSGLNYETPVGGASSFKKISGLKKFGQVTLKKGIVKKGFIRGFNELYENIKLNVISRKTVTIKSMDEAGKPAITWILTKAWITKATPTDKSYNITKDKGKIIANSKSNIAAKESDIESIEIEYENLSILNEK